MKKLIALLALSTLASNALANEYHGYEVRGIKPWEAKCFEMALDQELYDMYRSAGLSDAAALARSYRDADRSDLCVKARDTFDSQFIR